MQEETVVLKVFTREIDAMMARDILHDEGVQAFILKDDGGGMEPHLQRTNGVSLVIHRADTDRASQILNPLFSI